MATRFYFNTATGGPVAPVTVTPSTTWGASTSSTKLFLIRKGFTPAVTTIASAQGPTNGGATQTVMARQYVSEPLTQKQVITGTISLVMSGLEANIAHNIQLACIVRVVSQDGSIERGVLLSNLAIDIEWGTTQATRILSAGAVTPVTAEAGDRIVVELGDNHVAGTLTTASAMFYGLNAADFALTSGLTTNLRPWIEFSQDLWPAVMNNYSFVSVSGDGMSASGRIR